MKNILIAAACAVAMAAVAAPALAGSLTGEVRFGDLQANNRDTTEYRLEYDDTANLFGHGVNGGLELTVKQPNNAGNVSSKVVLKAGPALSQVYGFQPVLYGEVGQSFSTGHNAGFWGAGVGVSHPVYGPLSANVGYRHRSSFGGDLINEDRENAGLSYALTSRTKVAVNYYHTEGTTRSDTIGLGLTHQF